MKTIGILGGMSWESTLEYYRLLNQGIRAALGGQHSARIALYSVDFAQIEQLQHEGHWEATAEILAHAAQGIQAAGADFLLIATNTMHKVADQVQAQIDIPVLHIADATADSLEQQGIRTAGLLGTRFTMEQDFYRKRLEQRGIQVLVPDAQERALVHEVIYNELCQGIIEPASRARYQAVISGLAARGAEGVILGCTEIPLLLRQQDTPVPLFDTTAIHARSAVARALG
ncbi:aspartate/glutamate racemase family protein [Microbulbifer sediminum]|uniref:aspartate/glutamate racemase family protein n=1 Tax=Microbulbifer sediminum TaxID=2904250 RepID=UPI001F1E82D7|nr:aspartate/glutamate racemase family protein [Microbulbifer sediminum]